MEKQKSALRLPFIISLVVAIGFAALIALLSPQLVRFEKPVDQGSWWYFWQLAQPTFWTQLSAWGGYFLHQVFIWVVVAFLLRERGNAEKLGRWNIIALWGNLFFMALHLLQTQLFYDGLAQDVPVWTSQWSVIIMLVLIIVLNIPRRGLVFGLKVPLLPRFLAAIQKSHGLYISWALVYTFWFHPMEGDYGLLTGFFYMFLLFIQLSFARTTLHRVMGWIVVLELVVGIHGPAIALQKMFGPGGVGESSGLWTGIWPMFLFGFLGCFVLTGQYGFKLKLTGRIAVFAVFIALLIVVYAFRGYPRIYEISFIPVGLIGGAGALVLVGNGIAALFKGRQK